MYMISTWDLPSISWYTQSIRVSNCYRQDLLARNPLTGQHFAGDKFNFCSAEYARKPSKWCKEERLVCSCWQVTYYKLTYWDNGMNLPLPGYNMFIGLAGKGGRMAQLHMIEEFWDQFHQCPGHSLDQGHTVLPKHLSPQCLCCQGLLLVLAYPSSRGVVLYLD